MNPKSERKYRYRFLCSIILCVIAVAMFCVVWIDFVTVNNQTNALTGYGNIGMALIIYTLLFYFSAKELHGFRIGIERKANIIASNIIALCITDILEVLVSMAITGQFRFFFSFVVRYTVLFFAQSVIIGLAVIPMINIYRKVFPPLRLMEVYGDYRNDVYAKIDALRYKYHIEERYHYADERLEERIHHFDAVLINDVPSAIKGHILKQCFEYDKRAYFVPKISDIIIKSSEELNLIDTPLNLCRNSGITSTERTIKRMADIIISLLALIILSPILVVTAVAIKLCDGGPVFYKQERMTLNNKRFLIIKFRSMIVDAEKEGKPQAAVNSDDRITKVGRIIRASRIDELPQLINILRGEMSIVGPRPERVEFVEQYVSEIPEFNYRYKVKGGLTGYAQVYGKYNTTPLDKLKLDLFYITNYSLLMDFQIILETVKILFQKESTEGFSEERSEELRSKGNAA